jgi:hypothetical protein
MIDTNRKEVFRRQKIFAVNVSKINPHAFYKKGMAVSSKNLDIDASNHQNFHLIKIIFFDSIYEPARKV